MSPQAEKILVVLSDRLIGDQIAQQALLPLGYSVVIVTDGANAIQRALHSPPDLIISGLDLPGLSGKDLLVALNSQGVNIPFIVLVDKGQHESIIQAFRLGAADFLLWPARDAEIVNVVERVLKQVRERRSRQMLDRKLKETNQELQQRINEMTAIASVGRAVISINDQRQLFDKIVEGVVTVSRSDMGWLLLRDERRKDTYYLAAYKDLPRPWAGKLGQALNDGISSLVALSGETLAIDGEALMQFNISQLGKSAIVAPIKVQREVIGLLAAVRRNNIPFSGSEQTLLEAIADYASISLVNSRLFRALKHSAETAQAGEKRKNEQLANLGSKLQAQIQNALYPVELLLTEKPGSLTSEQRQTLNTVHEALKQMLVVANQAARPKPTL